VLDAPTYIPVCSLIFCLPACLPACLCHHIGVQANTCRIHVPDRCFVPRPSSRGSMAAHGQHFLMCLWPLPVRCARRGKTPSAPTFRIALYTTPRACGKSYIDVVMHMNKTLCMKRNDDAQEISSLFRSDLSGSTYRLLRASRHSMLGRILAAALFVCRPPHVKDLSNTHDAGTTELGGTAGNLLQWTVQTQQQRLNDTAVLCSAKLHLWRHHRGRRPAKSAKHRRRVLSL
jgi:hypothetical protein